MSVSEVFVKALKKWLELDTQINEINTKMKEIKSEKNNLESQILSYIKNNNLNDKTINLGNNAFSYNTTTTHGSLSIKLITEVLNESIADESLRKRILNNINLKKQEITKYNYNLKVKKSK